MEHSIQILEKNLDEAIQRREGFRRTARNVARRKDSTFAEKLAKWGRAQTPIIRDLKKTIKYLKSAA